MSYHPVLGFRCDGCDAPRMSDSECDACASKRFKEFWDFVRKRADEYDVRERMPEEHARYRAALERIAVMTRAAVLDDPLFAWAIARDALKGTE